MLLFTPEIIRIIKPDAEAGKNSLTVLETALGWVETGQGLGFLALEEVMAECPDRFARLFFRGVWECQLTGSVKEDHLLEAFHFGVMEPGLSSDGAFARAVYAVALLFFIEGGTAMAGRLFMLYGREGLTKEINGRLDAIISSEKSQPDWEPLDPDVLKEVDDVIILDEMHTKELINRTDPYLLSDALYGWHPDYCEKFFRNMKPQVAELMGRLAVSNPVPDQDRVNRARETVLQTAKDIIRETWEHFQGSK